MGEGKREKKASRSQAVTEAMESFLRRKRGPVVQGRPGEHGDQRGRGQDTAYSFPCLFLLPESSSLLYLARTGAPRGLQDNSVPSSQKAKSQPRSILKSPRKFYFHAGRQNRKPKTPSPTPETDLTNNTSRPPA